MSEKITISTDDGRRVDALAPIVISASRSTDIPAFYSQWFLNRLRAGYCAWTNPFNQKVSYVSFSKMKAIVFWSKNPKPLIPHLKELDEKGIHYYFQYTLNNYDTEGLEPNIPSLNERIETFIRLSELVGKEKVIWRFDPLILTDKIGIDELLSKIEYIGDKLKDYTDKLVFSYADISVYKKVENSLRRLNVMYKDFTIDLMNSFAEKLIDMNKKWKLSLASCAEFIDLGNFGIEHNRCIDAELMKRIFSDDKDFVYYLTNGRLPERNSLFSFETQGKQANLKDKGQRKSCGCMISKDIGMYNTCSHFCAYCYANTSKEVVEKNRKCFNINNESIL